jgi:hypothetical protein
VISCRAALFATTLALVVPPAAAQAQGLGLDPDRSCYGAHQVISLNGWGFTPDGEVALSAGGQQLGIGVADYDGVFAATLRAPALPFPEAELRFTATDQTYLLNRVSAVVRLTSLGVRVTPTTGDPALPRRIRARGFFGGRTLYAHIRRDGRVRNLRVGRLSGACRRVDATRRLFRAGVRPGAYSLSFDTNRRFYRAGGGAARITYAVEIARRSPARASGTAHTERWTLLSANR